MDRRKHRWQNKPKKDRTGQIFGKLKVISFARYELKQNSGGRKLIWNCECECGNEKEVENSNLISGNVKSCGCLLREVIKIVHKKNIKKGIAFEYVWKEYVKSAEERQLEFTLTKDQFRDITQQNCYYCGIQPHTVKDRNGSHIFKASSYIYNGIDRIDNSRGYTIINSVPCCRNCNIGKGTKTRDEFLAWVSRVYHHQEA